MLIACRKDAGLTQKEVAKLLGKPQNYVSRYERGERRLDVLEFLAVARATGFDPAKFMRELGKKV